MQFPRFPDQSLQFLAIYKWLYDLILVLVLIVSHGDDPKKLKLNEVGYAESNQLVKLLANVSKRAITLIYS